MKKIRMSLLFSLLLPIVAGSGASNVFAETTLSGAKKDSKILVACFSRADENYGVGVVKKGNTQILAEFMVQELKSDSFHIQTLTPYPKNYRECTNVASEERKNNARPKLAGSIPNVGEYDIIFLGCPIWWGDLPMAMYTFLETSDFSGKNDYSVLHARRKRRIWYGTADSVGVSQSDGAESVFDAWADGSKNGG